MDSATSAGVRVQAWALSASDLDGRRFRVPVPGRGVVRPLGPCGRPGRGVRRFPGRCRCRGGGGGRPGRRRRRGGPAGSRRRRAGRIGRRSDVDGGDEHDTGDDRARRSHAGAHIVRHVPGCVDQHVPRPGGGQRRQVVCVAAVGSGSAARCPPSGRRRRVGLPVPRPEDGHVPGANFGVFGDRRAEESHAAMVWRPGGCPPLVPGRGRRAWGGSLDEVNAGWLPWSRWA